MTTCESPAEDHLLDLAARLFAADAAVAEALEPRPMRWPGRLGWWLRRHTTARIAVRIRPDVAELAAAAWTVMAELAEAEHGLCTARDAARRVSALPGPGHPAASQARRPAASRTLEGVVA
jgi:hypothetical protein